MARAANSSRVFTTVGCRVLLPLSIATTSDSRSTPKTSRLFTTAASRAFCLGTMMPLKPSSRACMAMGSTPLMGSTVPSSESSPMMRYSCSSSAGTCSEAAMMPTASGRS